MSSTRGMKLMAYDSNMTYGIVANIFNIELDTGETSGITSVQYDASDEREYTRFDKMPDGEYRQIRPHDKERELTDLTINGWVNDPNYHQTLASLLYLSKRKRMYLKVASPYVVSPTANPKYGGSYDSWNRADSTIGWYGGTSSPGSNGSVSIDSVNRIEGAGSVKYTASSGANTMVRYAYPEGSGHNCSYWTHVYLWLWCDAGSTQFSSSRVYVRDDASNEKYWNISFSPSTWTEFTLARSSGVGGAGMIDRIQDVRVQLTSGPSYSYVTNVDNLMFGRYGVPDNKPLGGGLAEAAGYAVESLQVTMRASCRFDYTLKLKKINDALWD